MFSRLESLKPIKALKDGIMNIACVVKQAILQDDDGHECYGAQRPERTSTAHDDLQSDDLDWKTTMNPWPCETSNIPHVRKWPLHWVPPDHLRHPDWSYEA